MNNEEQTPEIKKIKQIPSEGSFVANGTTYYIENELSIDRWIMMQGYTIELGFGVEYSEMQKNWRSIVDLANSSKFADIVIMAYNMTNGISKIYQKNPQILKFCALYMNTADEDRGMISEDLISKKIQDWKTEGLGMDGFFVFSLLKVKNLAEDFQSATRLGSELIAQVFPES